ncbi:hypothetical protein TTX_1921 [Thermoproteus tenax Kra 1]|uniref:Uncharacterized protein n=1 Tax=Thermoproteus tenax (strain ATCC 35583 / DSM 2078 / JCM 9277 / NBRC 100435 / Kra 1) TaxID=768679 RepID=G4RLU1_THETK|nr:hypothetical protein TTX_1921 [Thermoproteus tenax Kra 1]
MRSQRGRLSKYVDCINRLLALYEGDSLAYKLLSWQRSSLSAMESWSASPEDPARPHESH